MQRFLKNLSVAALFIFLAAIPFIWLRKPSFMINGVDTNFPLNPLVWFSERFYVWNPLINGGSDTSSSVSAIFFHGLQAFFYRHGFSLINTEKLTLIFWLLLLGFSIYFLFRTIQNIYFNEIKSFASYLAAISAVIFYVFNLFQMDVWKNVKVANLMLLIAGPLALAIVMRLQYKKLSFPAAIVWLTILLIVCAGMGLNPAYFFLFVFTLVSWLIFYFLSERIFARKDLKQQLSYALGTLLCIALVSAFWIMPLFSNMLGFTGEKVTTLQALGAQQWLDGLSQNTSILAVLRVLGAWDWYANGLGNLPYVAFANVYFNNPFFIFYSLLIPLLAFCGFYIYRARYIAYYFTLLIFIGLIFGTGSHEPFGTFYVFLSDHLPFFSFFRSPWYIFSYLTVLGYAVCIGLFVQYIVTRFRISASILVGLLLIGNLIYTFPMIRGDIFRPYQTVGTYFVNIPQYVFDASSYLNTLPPETRVLLTPQTDVENYYWGYSGVTPLINLSSGVGVVSPAFGQSDIGALALQGKSAEEELFEGNTQGVKRSVGIMGITHMLSRKDLYDENLDNLKPVPDNRFTSDIFDLSATKHFGPWDLYTVNSNLTQPLFWIPTSKVSVDGDVETLPKVASFPDFPLDTEVTFTSGIKTSYQRQLASTDYNQSYIIPTCIVCEGYEHRGLILPYVRFLPGSIFYKFILWKEKRGEKAYPDALSKSQYYLSLADKRLSEIQNFVDRKETDANLVNESISGFDTDIQQTISLANTAMAQGQDTTIYWVDLFDHLSAYTTYIHTLEKKNNLQSGVFQGVDNEALQIEQYKKNMQNNLWYSDNLQTKRMVFNIPTDGTYTLYYRKYSENSINYSSYPALTSLISIDGQPASPSATTMKGQWVDRGSYTLQPGKHKLEVKLPPLKNLAHIDKNKTLAIQTNNTVQIKVIPVDELFPSHNYHLSFQYRTLNGLPPRFIFSFDGNTSLNSFTNQNTHILDSMTQDWQTYTFTFPPPKRTSQAKLVFITQADNSDDGTDVEIRNIQLVDDSSPDIMLYRQIKPAEQAQEPTISYKAISPVKYLVSVNGAASPFTLLFNQSFGKGWKATIDGQKIPVHYLENGYANAWDIDKTGNYQVEVVYSSQKLFTFGVMLVIGILIICVLIVIFLKTKKLWKK